MNNIKNIRIDSKYRVSQEFIKFDYKETKLYDNGNILQELFFLNKIIKGYRDWDINGYIFNEYTVDKNNLKHGFAYIFYPDGKLFHKTYFFHGKEHGIAKQWDTKGKLVCSYKMNMGTGIDLWWDSGFITESRSLKNGIRHGVEKLYATKNYIYEENYFYNGKQHGIHRMWNETNRLEKNFPKFFINDIEVDYDKYISRTKTNKTLPKYHPSDDKPNRPAPKPFYQ